MKVDTTTIRVKDWGGEQMIEINKHAQKKDKIRGFPCFSIQKKCYEQWKDKMQTVMRKRSQKHQEIVCCSKYASAFVPSLNSKSKILKFEINPCLFSKTCVYLSKP